MVWNASVCRGSSAPSSTAVSTAKGGVNSRDAKADCEIRRMLGNIVGSGGNCLEVRRRVGVMVCRIGVETANKHLQTTDGADRAIAVSGKESVRFRKLVAVC